jgi:23S rRNA pseudouridine955/2504/2580 synthase
MKELGKESVTFIEIDEGSCDQRIDNFLSKYLKGVPKSHIYRILRSGEVRVNKKRVDQTCRLQLGDMLRIPPVRVAEREAATDYVPAAEFPILYEDDAVSSSSCAAPARRRNSSNWCIVSTVKLPACCCWQKNVPR